MTVTTLATQWQIILKRIETEGRDRGEAITLSQDRDLIQQTVHLFPEAVASYSKLDGLRSIFSESHVSRSQGPTSRPLGALEGNPSLPLTALCGIMISWLLWFMATSLQSLPLPVPAYCLILYESVSFFLAQFCHCCSLLRILVIGFGVQPEIHDNPFSKFLVTYPKTLFLYKVSFKSPRDLDVNISFWDYHSTHYKR